MRASRLLLALLILCLAMPTGAAAQSKRPKNRPDPPTRLRVEAGPGGSILVHGQYPRTSSSCVDPIQPLLHERYRGAVEVLRASDGSLTLIGELPFEDYLKGIAEVPRSWPMEALKAQVVAARSYAASQLDPGGLYDLCATDACQVYMGMGVERGAHGRRWVRAVEATEGEVLLYRGEPATTFYFSTSNGRTYTNQQVWGSAPLPYLPSIDENDDGASPLSEWHVEVPFDDLEAFLRTDGRWAGGKVRRVRAREDGKVAVQGPGARVVLGREELRDALNDTARCLMPFRYPTEEPDGYTLPQSVPSKWFQASVENGTLVLDGRGWGHGIGLVQWGAYGKAKRGLAYDEILGAYYGGFRPQRHDLRRTIRVLLATGLTSVAVAPEGDHRARLRGGDAPPDGPWRVTPGGRGIRVRRGPAPDPELEVQRFTSGPRADTDLKARLQVESGVRVRLEVLTEDGVREGPWRSRDEGGFRVGMPVPEGVTGPVEIRARVTDGVDTITTGTRRVLITAAAAEPDSPSPEPSEPPPGDGEATGRTGDGGGALLAALIGASVALALLLGLLMLRAGRGKGLHRS